MSMCMEPGTKLMVETAPDGSHIWHAMRSSSPQSDQDDLIAAVHSLAQHAAHHPQNGGLHHGSHLPVAEHNAHASSHPQQQQRQRQQHAHPGSHVDNAAVNGAWSMQRHDDPEPADQQQLAAMLQSMQSSLAELLSAQQRLAAGPSSQEACAPSLHETAWQPSQLQQPGMHHLGPSRALAPWEEAHQRAMAWLEQEQRSNMQPFQTPLVDRSLMTQQQQQQQHLQQQSSFLGQNPYVPGQDGRVHQHAAAQASWRPDSANRMAFELDSPLRYDLCDHPATACTMPCNSSITSIYTRA